MVKKLLTICSIVFIAIFSFNAHSALVSTGDTVTADFDISGLTPAPPYDALYYYLDFGGSDFLNPGEGFVVNAYNSSGSLLGSDTFTNTSSSNYTGVNKGISGVSVTLGTIEITDIVGSFELIQIGMGGYTYSSGFTPEVATTNFQVVPIPAAVWLFGSGLIGLIGVARRKKS